MRWTRTSIVVLVTGLLSWSPILVLVFLLAFLAIVAGYYGRSDGRIPNP